MMGVLEYFLRNHLKHSKPVKQEGGFTLIELLVAMVLAVLVITPLLGFMINILDNDRREQAKATSEQEVQTALDYISRDLQQALYIYDADGLSRDFNADATLSGIRDQLPPGKAAGMCKTVAGTQCLPVLAFWKRKLEKDAIKIGSATDDTFVYSLVAYYLVKDSNATWSKAARIARFEISDGVQSTENSAVTCGTDYPDEKFAKIELCPDAGFKRFTLNDKRGTIQEKMNQWKAQTTAYTQSVQVLNDFVDQTTSGTNLPAATCPADEKDADGNEITKWSKITPGSFTSFYACVETLKTPNSIVQLSLRGNALARLQNNNIDYNQNNKSYFPTASIRVQGRGYLFTK
jgi:prepilin-type N-terminal cleavage/methylation domain-containing protein